MRARARARLSLSTSRGGSFSPSSPSASCFGAFAKARSHSLVSVLDYTLADIKACTVVQSYGLVSANRDADLEHERPAFLRAAADAYHVAAATRLHPKASSGEAIP
ncbi:hypothetical protein MRX96_033456 [Rhipicephalus microplus]